MTTLFVIFLLLVVAHLIMEGIIAPSERSKVRLDLFALRDEIRSAKIDYPHEFSDELYDHMQSHVNKSIHLLHNYNIVGLIQAIRLERKNPKVDERMKRFYDQLYKSNVPGLFRIHLNSLLCTGLGLVLNSVGWAIYFFFPILISSVAFIALYLFLTRAFSSIKERCGRLIAAILEIPDYLFTRFFPTVPREFV